jgi:hypothetical protein
MKDPRNFTIYVEDGDGADSALPDDFPPEKRLLIAMVQRALVDYICPEKGKAHLQYDAGAWIFSSARSPFSLFWVCEILSVCPEHLYARIQVAARSKEKRPKCVIMRVDTK